MGNGLRGAAASPPRARPVERPPSKVRRSRSVDDVSDPAAVLCAQQRQAIEAHAQAIRARGADVNVFLVAPATIGGSEFCSAFEELTEGAFRYADLVTTMSADQSVARSYGTKVRRLESNQSVALEALASIIQREDIHARRPVTARGKAPAPATQLPTLPAELSIAAHFYFNAELVRTQYILDLERALTDRGHTVWAQRQRMRIYCGSALDASIVPHHARAFMPLFDQLTWSTLEQTADVVWAHYTRVCPLSTMLFVYVHYTDEAYEAAYDAYATRRLASRDERQAIQALQPMRVATKWSADRLYYTGQSAAILRDYYVLVFTCTSAVLTSETHRGFIALEILKAVDELQRRGLWGAESDEEARLRFISTPEWRSRRVVSVPDSLLPETPSAQVRRRSSLDGSGISHASLPRSESHSSDRKQKERVTAEAP